MLTSKDKCTGCSACYSICPHHAITMDADKTGFLYPTIHDALCVNCNLCKSVCPIISPSKKEDFHSDVYVFQHNDERVRLESTSGGAFSAFAEEIIQLDGVVFGASFDENFVVRHTYAECSGELSQFRNSKYVQSEIRNTYKEAKAFLEQGRYVLFSGTPCQIQGLRNFLKKEYEKLLLVDLICLAVPSPKVFKKYLEYKRESIADIKRIYFRNKDLGYSYPTMLIKGSKNYRSGSESDEWLRLFLKKYSIRSSCMTCSAQDERASDITLYDCNNVYEKYPQIDDDKGTSNILINTQKGAEMFSKIADKHLTFKSAETFCTHKRKPTIVKNFNSSQFYDDLDQLSAKSFFQKYVPLTPKILAKKYGRMLSYKFGFYKKLRSIIRSLR